MNLIYLNNIKVKARGGVHGLYLVAYVCLCVVNGRSGKGKRTLIIR